MFNCPAYAQAGWWFISCFYAIPTIGATTIATPYLLTYHTNSGIMWSDLNDQNDQNNWLKLSAGKFTLKLK